MQTRQHDQWRVLRIASLTAMATLVILVGWGWLGVTRPAASAAVQVQPTPVPSPQASVSLEPITSGAAECTGAGPYVCAISSRGGWQQTPLNLGRGNSFSITYLQGHWSVDQRRWFPAGPEGYSADVDRQIGYAELCKIDRSRPYAALLGKVDEGVLFFVGRGGDFKAERDGPLSLTINDHPICQGDNDGRVFVRIETPQTPTPTPTPTTMPTSARLEMSPVQQDILLGATGATQAQVAQVNNLYGVQFRLTFNKDVVQVVDADPNKPGMQIAVGSLFSGKDYYVAKNEADNVNGSIEFAITLRSPALPIGGSGPVAVITWRGKGEGESALTLTQTGLADYPDGKPIDHTVANGQVRVIPVISSIYGNVLMQGANDHSGTNVFLTEGPRTCAVKICAQEMSNVPLDVTDRDGHFDLTPFPGRSYPWLWAYHACYLTGAKHWPQGNLGTLTLPAGDLNEDDCINIFDLAKMASQCLGTNNCPCADFNQDGKVDIFDLVIVAGNFGKCGSVSDWR